jgi:thiol-disulfide isomerase/thioredoxin
MSRIVPVNSGLPPKAGAAPLISRRTSLGLLALGALAVETPALAESARGWLGLELAVADKGVLVKRVLRGSPADKVQMKAGDLVLRANGEAVANPRALISATQKAGPGNTLTLDVLRAEQSVVVKVEVEAHPGQLEVLRRDKVGTFAASWKGVTAAQGEFSDIKQLRGKVVLLDFWASWCSACRAMAPVLNALSDEFGAQGLRVVGLTDDTAEDALAAARKQKIKYAIGATTSVDTIKDYFVSALPTFFLIDRKGVIRGVQIGESSKASFEPLLKKLLAEAS